MGNGKVDTHRSSTQRVDTWAYDYGKVVLLAGNGIEVYDGDSGNFRKTNFFTF